jgi:cobalt-zinc-cadmium efflux system membrane fusion protein
VRAHVVCVALAVAAAAACGHGERETAPEEAREDVHPATRAVDGPGRLLRIAPEMLRDLRVTTSVVEARPGGDGVTALGEMGVDEGRAAEIGSPIAARVVAVHADIGDEVAPGHPLALLESVELGKARADVVAARARRDVARQALARKRSLAGVVPRREVEEADADAVAAAAELRAAEASLQALGVADGDAAGDAAARLSLRAPIAGTVIARDLARGQMVDPARVLFRVADLSRLWLTVHAFERDAVRVAAGATARIALAALPGRDFSGTVAVVGRRVDPASRTIAVRIAVENGARLLRPGMSATAWLPFAEEAATVVTVPAAALQRLADGWAVFLPHGDGAFEPRRVGRGRDLGGQVEILHGLAPGETVVVDGAFLLKAEAEKAAGEGEHHDH